MKKLKQTQIYKQEELFNKLINKVQFVIKLTFLQSTQISKRSKQMKKQQIKDKEKLFKKLFISPSYCQPLDPPLLVSPDFINLLLQQSAHTSKQYQIQLINDILKVFLQRPTNSLLLCAHDQHKLDGQKCILDSMIFKIMDLIRSEQQIQLYLQKIELMLSYYRVTLANIRKITQWISKSAYIQKFDSLKLMFLTGVLKLYYSRKLGSVKCPNHYFYIFGFQNIGIQPVQNALNDVGFKNQLSITLSFNSQGQYEKLYNLFYIKTEKKQQIGLTYSQGTLKISALSDGQYLDEFIIVKGLSDQIWYRIIINLNTTQTECIIQNQTYKGRALIKKDRQRKITGCVFGRQFFGMLGSVLVSNKNISLEKFQLTYYPYGIDSIDHLVRFAKSGLPPQIIVSCLPFCNFEVREILHCFDIFKRNHSSIADNIVTLSKPINQNTLDHLGGCTILLPLFYLSRFYNKNTYPHILQDLLQITLEITRNYNIQQLQTQFEQTHFLEILGQHLADIHYLQTQKSVSLIFEIYKRLRNQRSKITYIHDVIWSLNIGIETSYMRKLKNQLQQKNQNPIITFREQVQAMSPTKVHKDQIDQLISLFYKKMLLLLYEQSEIFYKSTSLAEVIYWVVQHIESNQQYLYSCCLQHHLNQSVLSYEMRIQDMVRLDSSHIKTHYSYLQEILANFLQYNIRQSKQNAIEQLKTLLRLFLQKYSACFYLTILRSIKRQIMSSNVTSKQITTVLTDHKLEITSFLSFLSQKTINPDIISQILYIALFVHKHTSSNKKQQLIKFIVNLLKTNQQIQIKNLNPLRILVKKVRKSSEQIFTKKQEEISDSDKRIIDKQLFELKQQKRKKVRLDRGKISRIIQRLPKPQKIKSYKSIYNIILNQLSNQVSECQCVSESYAYNQGSIVILKQYYKLCQPVFKQSILLFLLSNLEKDQQLRNIHSLTIFLLECLKDSIFNHLQQTKSLLTIFTCIFSQILITHSDILDYYCSIKFLKLSRSCISVILPYVISKVIKLADLLQLSQFLMISLYETIQSPGQNSFELSHMVLTQINNKILKNKKQEVYKKQNISVNENQILSNQLQIFCNIICKNTQNDINLLLSDPFSDEQYQEIKIQQIQSQNNLQLRKNRNYQQREKLSQQIIQSQQRISKNINTSIITTPSKLAESTHTQKNNIHNTEEKLEHGRQLRVIQVYIKLYFKLIERKLNPNKQKQLKKKLSLLEMQSSSIFKKSKAVEVNYSFQSKQVQSVIKQFTQVIILYFSNIIQNKLITSKSYFRFILSFLIYKMQKLKNKAPINQAMVQILTFIISNACFPFIIQQVGSLQQICSLISQQDNKLIFIDYFSNAPFKFTFQNFAKWKKNPEIIASQLHESKCYEIFAKDGKFIKFFNQIQDLHDLITVSYFQKNMQKYIGEHQKLMSSFFNEKSFRNFQKLFDAQNAAEEKTRATFLYDNQCRFRKYHYQWDQLWNKLRVYHQPYGFWMAQKFKDSVYTYPKNQIRNFKFEISQFPGNSGLYPILQPKLIQPWIIVKDSRIKKNKYINSFSQMMKPSYIKIEKSNTNENKIINLWKGMLGLNKKKNHQKVHQYDVVLISRSTKATGKLFLQNKQQIIFCFEGARQDDNHLSFQRFSLGFNRQTFQRWPLFTIQKIRVHRYLLRYDALQFILNDQRSIIFNFVNKDKQIFLKQIQKIQKQKIQTNNNLKLFKLNKIPFLDDNFIEYKGIQIKLTQSWIKRQISNLEYLIKINRAASRGIYDLSQYMVVPWVVQFKKQKQPKYRDLNKTMGGLGSEQRKKIISQKYYSKDPFNPYPPFYFGTHYSSPGVVFNLLIRLSPFTQYCKHLQGGKFDIPDRLFSSLISTWRSASQQVSDVRQLIPQMYYLPQLLLNIDQNHFGYTQNNQLVNHVQIPPWGANNPYYFISQLRQIMQSDEVSQKINEWIDLIFGYKQKGKEAQTNFNVYYYLTYQDYVDADEDEDQVYKKSRQAQIVHFGQVPPMLFDKPHPKRNKPQFEPMYQLKIIKSIRLMNSLKQRPIGLKISNNQLMICKRNQFQVYTIQSDPAALQKKKKFNFEKSMSQTYYLIKKQKSNVYFFQKPFFIIWGYLSNQFRIFNKNSGQIDQSAEIQSKITALFVNKSQDLILVGSSSGILTVFQIQYGLTQIFVKVISKQFFPYEIVHISQFDGFYAITFGNYSGIYKISRSLHYLKGSSTKASIKFFRSFYNSLPLKASFIMSSPLYTIILVDNANIKSYSINGQFIKSINNSAKYFGRFTDAQLHDIFYTIDDDKVVCFSVPDLRSVSILQLPQYEQIIENYVINKNKIQQIGYTHN